MNYLRRFSAAGHLKLLTSDTRKDNARDKPAHTTIAESRTFEICSLKKLPKCLMKIRAQYTIKGNIFSLQSIDKGSKVFCYETHE